MARIRALPLAKDVPARESPPVADTGPPPVAPRRGRLHWKSLARMTVALTLLAAAAWYFYDNGVRLVGADAVVTAPTVTIRAPIEGRVRTAQVEIGTRVAAGEKLFTLEDPRPDDRLLAELEARERANASRHETIVRQVGEFEANRAALAGWIDAYTHASVARLGEVVRELEAERAGAVADQERHLADMSRISTLADRGVVSSARLDEARASALQAKARANSLAAAIARRRVELAAARDGINVVDGNSDLPSARQRLQDVDEKLIELRAQRDIAAATQVETRARLAAERQRLDRIVRSELVSPADGIIWNVLATAGTDVVRSTPLAEIALCDAAVIEVRLPESRYEEIAAGRPARVRLKGSDIELAGTVRSVRGAGSYVERNARAAATERDTFGLMTVVVELAAGELARAGGAPCPIGRTARVRFD